VKFGWKILTVSSQDDFPLAEYLSPIEIIVYFDRENEKIDPREKVSSGEDRGWGMPVD